MSTALTPHNLLGMFIRSMRECGYDAAEIKAALQSWAAMEIAIPVTQPAAVGAVDSELLAEIEEADACLDDDAATLLDENSEDEIAHNIKRACNLIEKLAALASKEAVK